MDKVAIDKLVLDELLEFLGQRPYNEVADMIHKVNKNMIPVNLIIKGEDADESTRSSE